MASKCCLSAVALRPFVICDVSSALLGDGCDGSAVQAEHEQDYIYTGCCLLRQSGEANLSISGSSTRTLQRSQGKTLLDKEK